ncbi:MAG: chordopoxvirus fusion protein [bacterium]
MAISLIREEQEHIIRVLPILLKKDEQFKTSLYSVLSETFVKKDDFSELKEIVRELGVTVKELAEAQKRTEQKVEELAEAQKRTEEGIRALTESHKNLAQKVGGLDHTVGFRLEDESYKALPGFFKRDMGLEIIGRLKRDYIETGKERYIEVNIFGKGMLNGKEYTIIGEAKSQLKKRDVDDFIKHAEMVKGYVKKEQIRVLVTYQAHPGVQDYVKKQGIRLYFSYEF